MKSGVLAFVLAAENGRIRKLSLLLVMATAAGLVTTACDRRPRMSGNQAGLNPSASRRVPDDTPPPHAGSAYRPGYGGGTARQGESATPTP
jgi:hypothetical protein